METNSNNNAEVQQVVNEALQQEKKKKKKKKWIIIGVVIVVLIIIFAAAGSSGSSGSGETANTTEAISDTQKESKSEDTKGPQVIQPGTALTTDELKISYVSCDADYTDYDEYSKPSDGKKVIRAKFSFENISKNDYSIDSIECYADNNKCEPYYYADDYASPVLESISPGRTLDAVVYYEVPKNAENIEIEMETNLWTEDKIVFEVK